MDSVLKKMFVDIIQETLEAVLDTELGYPKNGRQPKGGKQSPKRTLAKWVRSEHGELSLSVSRNREGKMEPIILKNHRKEFSGIEEQILALGQIFCASAELRTVCTVNSTAEAFIRTLTHRTHLHKTR